MVSRTVQDCELLMLTTLTLFLAAPTFKLSGVISSKGRPLAGAVIYLEGEGTGRPVKETIKQAKKTFTPHVLAVPVGSTVSFPNMDAIFHNVFAEYNAKKFDLGMYPPGETRTVTFEKPGLVSVLCNIHPNMSAYIMVVNSGIYGLTDSKGQFKLSGITSGTKAVRVWHESGRKKSFSLAVDTDRTDEKISLD
jgi:plastocyanin